MTYEQWEAAVPAEIKADELWNVEAYRLSLFLGELTWSDATKLLKDRRTASLSDQLYRAVAGISGTISEGFSRGSGKERARFYEYALGSARESRNAVYLGRHVLGEAVMRHRLELTTSIARLLLAMIPNQRRYAMPLVTVARPSRTRQSRNHVIT